MSDTTITPASSEKEMDPAIKAFFGRLALEATIDEKEASADFGAEIQARVLAAETEEDILEAGDVGTLATKEFINRPFRLREDHLEVRVSTLADADKEKNPFFLLLDVTEIATGEDITLNCGARTIMTQFITLRDNGILAKYENDGGMPLVITPKATRSGNEVLVLKKYNAPKVKTVRGKTEE